MGQLEDSVDGIAAETGFSGVVRVDRDGDVRLAKAYGRVLPTVHDPAGRSTHTVLSNTSDGAWPVTRRLDELLG